MNEEKTIEILKYERPDSFVMRLPDCCKEARDDCPHVVKKPEKIKKNIGL